MRRLPFRPKTSDAGEDVFGLLHEPRPCRMRALPFCNAAHRRCPERPHTQGRLSDVPHPHIRQSESHEALLGLVHGRQTQERRSRLKRRTRPGLMCICPSRDRSYGGKTSNRIHLVYGTASHYLVGDTLDPSRPLQLTCSTEATTTRTRRSIPSKSIGQTDLTTPQYRYLIQPKTVSTKPGDGGYWAEFNWDRAAEEGMKQVNLPYSGHYGFVQTEMYWPVNHMVSPKSQAVQCGECHTRENGPACKSEWFFIFRGETTTPGWSFLASVSWFSHSQQTVVHGSVRFLMNRKRKGSN